MTTYKGIRGLTIQTVAGDPDPLTVGDIWYSSTAKKIRGAKLGAGSWASGGNMNVKRQGGHAGQQGTQTAGITYGGDNPGAGYVDETETYDGSTWTEVGDLNVGRNNGAGLGTQTAAILTMGNTPDDTNKTELWNGTAWTEVGDVNTLRSTASGCGITTAGLITGGYTTAYVGISELFNGTSWTEVGDLNTVRYALGNVGVSTAAIAFAGANSTSYNLAVAETYDGSSWTEVGDLNTGRYSIAGFGHTQTAAVAASGREEPPDRKVALTECWDGSSWTEVADQSLSKQGRAGLGTGTLGLICGGNPGEVVSTEEWTIAQNVKVITD